ncbi:copper chaperone [Peptoniphilus asaccharolyticus DSM 20463]|uniref:Copper chaperone n=1 Tax=Peptoniphilus asaccharolyticus DSM 20463 TaxID=573058 RepID=A0A1W1VF29_PEPAS|nr:heavy metal-associated domain-containing protein [Peptoniphilus asaccharolyticus]SMB91906.1 copper chaperone [Peptoniphilus asaccharolyticus DSM 20463]
MEKKIKIEGMMCGHCKAAVEKALEGIEEVKKFTVDLEDKSATVEVESNIDEKLKEIIEEEGYTVVGIE